MNASTIKQELLSGKPIITQTKGVSMRPLLLEGKSYVVVESVNRDLQVGDLPLFIRSDGSYIIHRLVKIEGNRYYTLGDNCFNGEVSTREQIIGVVKEINRKGVLFSVNNKKYLRYSSFWMKTSAIRIFILRTKYKLRRLIKGLLRK